MITNPTIIKPKLGDNFNRNVFHIYPIQTEHRDALKKFLLENNVQTEIHYPVAPHNQEGYQYILSGSYSISEYLHAHLLSLPISFAHTEEEIHYVCEVLNLFNP